MEKIIIINEPCSSIFSIMKHYHLDLFHDTYDDGDDRIDRAISYQRLDLSMFFFSI